MSEPKITDSPTAPPGVRCSDLLESLCLELMVRRCATEAKAFEQEAFGNKDEAKGWRIRAAGLAEAVQVAQHFADSALSNTKISDPE